MTPQHIYCWHAPELNAIKVGRGRYPRERMELYAVAYGVVFNSASLFSVKVPEEFHADITETICHEALLNAGCWRFHKRHVNQQSMSIELFRLPYGVSYMQAVAIIRATILGLHADATEDDDDIPF